MTKTCTKCQVEKPLGEYYKNKSSKDGHGNNCINCMKIYKSKAKESVSLYNKQYREKNKEKLKLYEKNRYQGERRKSSIEREKQKLANMFAGVYKITNKKTGVFYIGCSTMIERRFWQHKHDLKNNNHWNKLLQEDWNEYGTEAFEFAIIKKYPANTLFEVLEKEETKLIFESLEKGSPLYNQAVKTS